MKQHTKLTPKQEKIIKEQIRKNTKVIDWLIYKIDLLVNKEGHQKNSKIVVSLQKKLDVLTEENDTFRKVFWKHVQQIESAWVGGTPDAFRYLILKVQEKHKASASNLGAQYEIGTATAIAKL